MAKTLFIAAVGSGHRPTLLGQNCRVRAEPEEAGLFGCSSPRDQGRGQPQFSRTAGQPGRPS
jgi:hypothetical protein